MSRLRRIAEEEYVVLVLLSGFGVVFLLVFPPFLLVADSWLNLLAGREIWQNGLPAMDELTVYGDGRIWTAQQWIAHLFFYGTYMLGGHPLLAVTTGAVVIASFGIAAAGARSLGAGPRAIWALLVPVLLAAPWAWTIRAQALALPLYAGLVWLLAAQARTPTRRVWLTLPILVLWANVHGSAALGALLVMLLAGEELVRTRGASARRSLPLLLAAPLAVLLTPYGPAATARYYHTLLVDPPFGDLVTEWQWPDPAENTMFFYLLVAIALPLGWVGRKRLIRFDLALLALTLAGALTAIRGVVWFAMACMVLLPVAIGRSLERRVPEEPLRRLNVGIAIACVTALSVLTVSSLARDESWYTRDWPDEPIDAVRSELRPGDRVFADSRFSDWLLWELPALRGRVAYDVRFELYDRDFFERLRRYQLAEGASWSGLADGFRIVLVDGSARSRAAALLREPGARAIHRSDEVIVVARAGS